MEEVVVNGVIAQRTDLSPDAAILAGQDGTIKTTADVPAWLPPKFLKDGKPDYEALAKSYTEAESRLTKFNQGSAPRNTPATDVKAPAGPADLWSEENVNKWSQEFETNGKLSEETYKEIGVPRPFVDQWLALNKNAGKSQEEQLMEMVGGEEGWTQVREWTRDNLTNDERRAIDLQLQSADFATRANTIQGLYARFQKSDGFSPERRVFGNPPSTGGGFESPAQMVAAMSDPRYDKDPAYRAQVMQRIKFMK